MRWTGQDKAAAWGQQQSLHPEDLGAPGIQLPQKSSERQGAGFLLFLLVSPREVVKYCPESPRDTQPQLLPAPSTTP